MNGIDYVARSTCYDAMPYRRLGSCGLKLPTLSLGLWQNFGKNSDVATARDLLLRAFDLGITHFDLANNYGPPPGAAEEFLGHVLSSDLASYRDELDHFHQGRLPDVAGALWRRYLQACWPV